MQAMDLVQRPFGLLLRLECELTDIAHPSPVFIHQFDTSHALAAKIRGYRSRAPLFSLPPQ